MKREKKGNMNEKINMEKGTLYWITGLAGSGKTMIGTRLYYTLREKENSKIVILDGDVLKGIVGRGGYSYADRLSRAKQYCNLCKFLVDQGMDVIICTIAMFDSIREWNRQYIEKYMEIFLDVPENVLVQRNKKGLYTGKRTEVAGRDVKVEFPKNPDIVLHNDGSISVEECVRRILNHKLQMGDRYDRDRKYWNDYYAKKEQYTEPSLFAKYIAGNLKPGETLMELGCGNGRDSRFFLSRGLYVIGIDASDYAIRQLRLENHGRQCEFICDDFAASKILYQRQVEHCYSRFTLHAINERQEELLLENVYTALKTNGRFYVEARSIHDDLYGLGKKVSEHTYIYNDHFRRFIDMEQLRTKIEKQGFIVEYMEEGRGFAPTDYDDPVLVRMICKKGEVS